MQRTRQTPRPATRPGTRPEPVFDVALARSADDLRAAQALRYDVFVREAGSDGPLVDHAAGLEIDRFDPCADHLLLRDLTRPPHDRVIGVYRLMDRAAATAAGGFSASGEYDLAPLLDSGRVLLELGRSCLHPDYRGGAAMYHLWHALSGQVTARRTEILFGTASFFGTDPAAIVPALSILHHDHLASPPLRVRTHRPVPVDLIPADRLDRRTALQGVPSLIKAYLRLGGVVGDGACIDAAFNTVDVCLILDLAQTTERARAIYAGPRRI